MLISQSLLNKENIYYIPESIKSLKSSYLFKGKHIYRWQTSRKKPRVHKNKGFSDHLPIMAKFTVKS